MIHTVDNRNGNCLGNGCVLLLFLAQWLGGNGAWWWISIFCAAPKFCFGNKISTFDDVLAVNLLEKNITPLCDNKTFAYFIVKTHSNTYTHSAYTHTHTPKYYIIFTINRKKAERTHTYTARKIGKKKIQQISNLFVELLKLLILLFISCRCDFNHFEWQPCIVSLTLSFLGRDRPIASMPSSIHWLRNGNSKRAFAACLYSSLHSVFNCNPIFISFAHSGNRSIRCILDLFRLILLFHWLCWRKPNLFFLHQLKCNFLGNK